MSLNHRYIETSKPRLNIVLLSLFSCCIVICMIVMFYQHNSSSLVMMKLAFIFVALSFVLLFLLCLLLTELYVTQQKHEKKIIRKLKSKQHTYIELKQELDYFLSHDIETQLPNKTAIFKELEKVLSMPARCSIFSISLDNLFFIADTHGDEIINRLLQEMILRFRSILGDKNMLAKVEFDKFLLLSPNISLLNAEIIAHQLKNALIEEFTFTDQEIELHCSIGIAHSKINTQANILIHQANSALRQAKRQTTLKIVTYHNQIQKELNEKKLQERALKHAINNDELTLYFQPQVNLKNKNIIGIETLIRWHDRNQINLMPAKLILQTAEQAGLTIQLSHWVIENAIKHYAMLLDERCAPNKISINASAFELTHLSFAEHICRTLNYYDIPRSRVEIDISEDIFHRNQKNTFNALSHLSELGLSLAINNFGTGYLSLHYLKKLPIHTIKLAPSFINNLHKSKKDLAICQTVITMANLLDIQVIIVGIEDEQQQQIIQSLGCHCAQGYYLSAPIPIYTLLNALKKQQGAKFTAEKF